MAKGKGALLTARERRVLELLADHSVREVAKMMGKTKTGEDWSSHHVHRTLYMIRRKRMIVTQAYNEFTQLMKNPRLRRYLLRTGLGER